MKNITITPSKLTGTVQAPSSKSIGHRAIICAALSKGHSTINNLGSSHDIEATLDAVEALGADIKKINHSTVQITGTQKEHIKSNHIHCKESGSTLRFLIPIAASLTRSPVTFLGKGRLGERPLTSYYEIFDRQNLSYTTNEGKLPLEIKGPLKPDMFLLQGDISSQFITGLLFSLPLLDGDSTLHITTNLESKGYIDLTLDTLKDFGISINHQDYKVFKIPGNQTYHSQDYTVESDYSQAAFWIVAGLIGEKISIKGLSHSSKQGDRMILDIVKKMKGQIIKESDSILIKPSKTFGTIIDASQCPDLVPILAVLGSVSNGTTQIINAARLRIKESDRLASTTSELKKLGADISETEDGLLIQGKEQLKGGEVDSWNDHRIAMAMAIASIKCTQPVKITHCDAINKSYPHFFEDFKSLGGNIK